MKNRNILVLGSNGQLGRELQDLVKSGSSAALAEPKFGSAQKGFAVPKGYAASAERGHADPNFYFVDIDQVDICKIEEVRAFVEKNSIDSIINAAAYTNVDAAEKEGKEEAKKVNHLAVAALAKLAKEKNIFLLHISTDYVFDGAPAGGATVSEASCPARRTAAAKAAAVEAQPAHGAADGAPAGAATVSEASRPAPAEAQPAGSAAKAPRPAPYKESDECHPLGVYGKTKYEGEKAMLQSSCIGVIIRTSWLYSKYGKNFVKTMLTLGSSKKEVSVVKDQIGSPTWAKNLAEVCLRIVLQRPSGLEIYHYSNEGKCSWAAFAKEIMQLYGLPCRVKQIETKNYPTACKRPEYSVLKKDKIKKALKIEIDDWKISLQKMLKDYGSAHIEDIVVEAMQEKKAEEIQFMNLSKLNTAFEAFVVCEANSTTQIRAIAEYVEELMEKKAGISPLHREGYANAQWIVIDYGTLAVHVFLKEERQHYKIEELWADAEIRRY